MSSTAHPRIVEGVMVRIVEEMARVYANANQRQWDRVSEISLGPVSSRREYGEYDTMLYIQAFGDSVGRWIDGKRPFYYSYPPDHFDNATLCDWAVRVFDALEDVDAKNQQFRLTQHKGK